MPRFRKKPVEIEAIQLTADLTADEFAEFIGDAPVEFDDTEMQIPTLEGVMTARPGDWIIRGVQGELYPCKPDIFDATYQAVSTPPQDPLAPGWYHAAPMICEAHPNRWYPHNHEGEPCAGPGVSVPTPAAAVGVRPLERASGDDPLPPALLISAAEAEIQRCEQGEGMSTDLLDACRAVVAAWERAWTPDA